MIACIARQAAVRFAPDPPEAIWEWAATHVDFGLAPNYDTPIHGPYDPDLCPYWKEPAECLTGIDVREVVVAKCSRSGGSENLLLNAVRHTVAVNPQPTLYLTSDQLSGERFMGSRIKRGLRCCPDAWRNYKLGTATEHDIRLPTMDLRVTWPKARAAFKQDGWALILGDEVSTWPEFAADMLRKRGDTYPFHHIVFLSSPDPARKGAPEADPILVLYAETDQREWFMPDPGAADKWFRWQFGGGDSGYGLKWPAECRRDDDTWDLDRVRDTAYYLTPAGTVITEAMRESVMRSGEWRPTTTGRTDRRGYKVVGPMVPFASGNFGNLAAEWLSAKFRLRPDGTRAERLHNPVRVYFAEYWAEAAREERVEAEPDALIELVADSAIGETYTPDGYDHGLVLTVDVQKRSLWWLLRCWARQREGDGVSSALVQWGNCATFADLEREVDRYEPSLIGLDVGYRLRASEVADFCAERTDQDDPRESRCVALYGNDAMKGVTDCLVRDAYEGRQRAGRALYVEIAWQPNVFRQWLMDSLAGESEFSWAVPADHGDDARWEGRGGYVEQVTSTRCLDGVWIPPGHGRDHLFDCEVMQLVLARWDAMIR